MSGSDSQDKTEDPTAQRLRKAREEGQIARSRELQSAVLVMVGGVIMLMVGNTFEHFIDQLMHLQFELTAQEMKTPRAMLRHFSEAGWLTIRTFFPIFGLLWLLLAFSGMVPGGWLFSVQALQPKFSRMNPISGIGRLFSSQSLVELAKSVLKVVALMSVLGWVLWSHLDTLLVLNRMPIGAGMAKGTRLLGLTFIALGMVLLLLAVLDVPFQRWMMLKKLRMSKREVKDEHRNTEGNPEIKQRIRQLQMQMSRQRINKRVPEADVVITNPTHYAVAIKYDPERAEAPFVLAKGADQLALRIREVAKEHSKTILELPELTRAVYHSTRIDQEIPAGLYNAIAQVLMYVMQLHAFQSGQGRAPMPLPLFTIPDSLKH